MTIITNVFFAGAATQLFISGSSIRYMNRLANRYTNIEEIHQQTDKYICESVICCILVILGYVIFTGMIIENMIKYELIASIVNAGFFSGLHIVFQYLYYEKIKSIIREGRVVHPYINSYHTENNSNEPQNSVPSSDQPNQPNQPTQPNQQPRSNSSPIIFQYISPSGSASSLSSPNPMIQNPIITTTTYVQYTNQEIQCIYSRYTNNPPNTRTIINPDGSLFVINTEK
jgi:hypothetical protein